MTRIEIPTNQDLEKEIQVLEERITNLTSDLSSAHLRLYVLEAFCRECVRAMPHETQREIYRLLHEEGNTGIRHIVDTIGESGAEPFRRALKGFVNDLPLSPRARMGDG